MDDLNGGGASQMSDQGGFNQTFDTIMNPSAGAVDQETGKVNTGGLTSGTPGANSQYQFAGRQWKDQSAAEKAYNKLYGESSDIRGTMNMVKKLLSDPEALAEAQQDPRWAPILEKLGLEAAEKEIEQEDRLSQNEQEVSPQQAIQEMKTFRASLGIEREGMQYEKKLGRSISDDEWNGTMRMISRSPSLSFEEAFFLANRQAMMSQAAKQAAQNTPARGQGRPKPLPRGIPGTSYDLKKPVESMGADEYREYLRSQPEFQALLNRE